MNFYVVVYLFTKVGQSSGSHVSRDQTTLKLTAQKLIDYANPQLSRPPAAALGRFLYV